MLAVFFTVCALDEFRPADWHSGDAERIEGSARSANQVPYSRGSLQERGHVV